MTTKNPKPQKPKPTVKTACVLCGEKIPHDLREYETLAGKRRAAWKGRAHRMDRPENPEPEWGYEQHDVCPSGIRRGC